MTFSMDSFMNKLQDMFSTKPNNQQIVMVGSQSSGKSSVLESLVGKSFLPRGAGVLMRAPLELNVMDWPEDEDGDSPGHREDWATFSHRPGTVFRDFNKVRKEIEARTVQLAVERRNVSRHPIVLNVYTRLGYNMCFVDLPGLIKVPAAGQPPDIEQKIRAMVLSYIENPNAVILAVVTANTDPATSESLHIAKSVDPDGGRTIAVVTKIDLMDKGTDANELLSGELIPVRLGIIGVINRSQKDINEQKSIGSSLANEATFFRKNYPSIADQHGTVVLGKRLQALFDCVFMFV